MRSVLGNFRYGVRTLRNSPGFLGISVLTLAVGIGANTTIFSAVEALLLRPLPFRDPDRIVIIREANNKNRSMERNPQLATSLEWQQAARSFALEMAVAYFEAGNLVDGSDVQRVRIQYVSQGLLPLLGVRPMLGRGFGSRDAVAGETPSILISHGLWVRSFGASPTVLGRTARLAGKTVAIIGVLPPGTWVFPSSADPEVWAFLDPRHNSLTPDTRYLSLLARLKNGTALEDAQAEMNVFAQRLAEASPITNRGWGVRVDLLRDDYYGGWSSQVSMLFGIVGFVLLIACVNVSSLLLARGAARRKEIAIRVSLGASRACIVRQLLSESLIVAFLAGALGIGLALGGSKILLLLLPRWFPGSNSMQIDWLALGFTLALSMATALVFGLMPSLIVSKIEVNRVLKQVARSGGGSSRKVRRILVVTEVALTLVLLMGAGLMINSFVRLKHVDPGFQPKGLLWSEVELLDEKYTQAIAHDQKRVSPLVDAFYRQLLERLEVVPGVESAAMSGMPRRSPVRVIGRPPDASADEPEADYFAVSTGYFATTRQSILRGRSFSPQDTEHSVWVAVVNETAARLLFGREDPIGKSIHFSFRALTPEKFPEQRPREIIGVARDAKHFGLADTPEPFVYVPNTQHNQVYPGGAGRTHVTRAILVRTSIPPVRFGEILRKIVAETDPDQTVEAVVTMEQMFAGSLSYWMFFLRIFSVFAGIAVLLAAVGIYGLVSDSVERRTHEIGLRAALGASARQVVGLVLSETLWLTAAGVVLGIGAAAAMRRLMEHMLWGVKATDAETMAAVAILLTVIALTASIVPVRRAIAIDPATALRDE